MKKLVLIALSAAFMFGCAGNEGANEIYFNYVDNYGNRGDGSEGGGPAGPDGGEGEGEQ